MRGLGRGGEGWTFSPRFCFTCIFEFLSMTTKTSTEMVAQIAKFEGLRLKAYKCAAGVWTIGYGHTGQDVTEAGLTLAGRVLAEITEALALELLARDLEWAEREVVKLEAEGVELWQNEFDALVSFVYNCGPGNFRTSTLRKVVKAKGRPVEVAAQLMRWNKAGGRVLPGLTKRRATEAAWYACGGVMAEALGDEVTDSVKNWVEMNGLTA